MATAKHTWDVTIDRHFTYRVKAKNRWGAKVEAAMLHTQKYFRTCPRGATQTLGTHKFRVHKVA